MISPPPPCGTGPLRPPRQHSLPGDRRTIALTCGNLTIALLASSQSLFMRTELATYLFIGVLPLLLARYKFRKIRLSRHLPPCLRWLLLLSSSRKHSYGRIRYSTGSTNGSRSLSPATRSISFAGGPPRRPAARGRARGVRFEPAVLPRPPVPLRIPVTPRRPSRLVLPSCRLHDFSGADRVLPGLRRQGPAEPPFDLDRLPQG